MSLVQEHTAEFFLHKSKGYQRRVEQIEMSDTVAGDLLKTGVSLIGADTGVGKTMAYLVPTAIAALEKNKQVIVSTHSRQLMSQICEKDMIFVNKKLRTLFGRGVSFCKLLGRGNFFNREKVNWWIENNQSSLSADDKNLCLSLKKWINKKSCTGIISDFIDQFGGLPGEMREQDVQQTHQDSSQEFYKDQKETASTSDIIITTHAMIVADIMNRGSIPGDATGRQRILIVDEADKLVEHLDAMSQRRLNISQLKSRIYSHGTAKMKQEIDLLEEMFVAEGKKNNYPYMAINSSIGIQDFDGLRKSIKRNQSKSPEVEEIYDDVESVLASRILSKSGIGYSKVRKQPAYITVSPYLSRLFGPYIKDSYKYTLLTSATLSVSPKPEGFMWIAKDLGLGDCKILSQKYYQPEKFGKMSITLVGDDFPAPFLKDFNGDESSDLEISEKWIKAVAQVVRRAEKTKLNVLVLTNSFKETKLLAAALSEVLPKRVNLEAHVAGESLQDKVHAFRKRSGVLITPSGGAGLDIRNDDGSQFFTELVITRVPFPPYLRNEEAAFIECMQSYGKSKSEAEKMLHFKKLGSAARLMKQKIGRGIRSADDNINIYICDRRYPSFGQKSRYAEIKYTIPTRFQVDYAKATIIGFGDVSDKKLCKDEGCSPKKGTPTGNISNRDKGYVL